MASNYNKPRNKIVWIFLVGVIIGVLLEIILIEIAGRNKPTEKHEKLKSKKLLCLILVKNKHIRNVVAAEQTWLPNCDDKLLVRLVKVPNSKMYETEACNNDTRVNPFSQRKNSCFEDSLFTSLNIKDIYAINSWDFLCQSFHLLKDRQFEWLIVVPDNVFVIVENVHHFIRAYHRHEEAFYLGHPIQHHTGSYNVLSAGVLMNYKTVDKILEKFVQNECHRYGKYWNNEDVMLGQHLRSLKITPKDTRDEEGRNRFHGYNINTLLSPGKLFRMADYSRKSIYPILEGENCCSPFSLTFDGTQPDSILYHYYFLYKLQKYPNLSNNDISAIQRQDEKWKEILREFGYTDEEIEKVTAEQYYKIWSKKIPPEMFYEKLRKLSEK